MIITNVLLFALASVFSQTDEKQDNTLTNLKLNSELEDNTLTNLMLNSEWEDNAKQIAAYCADKSQLCKTDKADLIAPWVLENVYDGGIGFADGVGIRHQAYQEKGFSVSVFKKNTISQTVAGLTAGTKYILSFRASARDECDKTKVVGEANVDGAILKFSHSDAFVGPDGWNLFYFIFTPKSAQATIKFAGIGEINNCALVIDRIRLVTSTV